MSPFISFLKLADINSELGVRDVLEQLQACIDATGCALLGLCHINQKGDLRAIERLLGSVAFANFVRSVLLVGRDKDEPDWFRLVHGKHDLSINGDDLLYRPVHVGQDPRDQFVRLEWRDPDANIDADSLFDRAARSNGTDKLALLGSIAMSALKNYQSGAAPSGDEVANAAPLGLREPQTPGEEAEVERTAGLILAAMISAAKADGQIDGTELRRVVGKLEEAGAGDEARQFVMRELQKPLDVEGLADQVRSPEVAAGVYAASLLAIEVDTPAERDYLRRLAASLGLDDGTVHRLHQIVGAPAAA